MKIGLYFGSFNPIHIGHLIIAQHILNHTEIQRLWFVISPHNPLKDKASLANDRDRLHLVQLAIEDNPSMKASDIEFKLPQPSYTINTLTYIKEKYPRYPYPRHSFIGYFLYMDSPVDQNKKINSISRTRKSF